MRATIQRTITKAKARIYLQRAMEGVVTGLIPALLLWMCLLVLAKTGWLPASVLLREGLAVLAFPLGGLVWAFARKIDGAEVAMRIDEVNHLKARLTTAWCFLQEAEPTDFMKAAIQDAAQHLGGIKVAQAAPLSVPRDLAPLGLAGLALVGLLLVKPPEIRGTLPPEEPIPPAEAVLDETELKLLKERWEQTKEELVKAADPEALKLSEDMDKLYQQLAQKELSREEFLSKVDEIKQQHFQEEDEEWKPILEEIKEIKDELKDNAHTKDLADALEKDDLEQAAKELEKLADKLEKGEIKDQDIDKLAEKLEKVADKLAKEDKALENLLKDKEKELEDLKKKLGDKLDNLDDEKKKKLSRLERDLKGLKDKLEAHNKSAKGRSLKKLSKAAKEGAEKLRTTKNKGKGASKDKQERDASRKGFKQAMGSAAEELRNVDKDATKGKAKEQAGRQLDDLKESARRNGKPSQERSERMKDFDQRASGQDPKDGKQGQQGQEGQQGQQGKEGQQGQQGQPGQQGQQGQPGQEGQQGQPGQEGQKGQQGQAKAGDNAAQSGGDKAGKAMQADGTDPNKQSDAKGNGEDQSRGTGKGGDTLGEATGLNGAKYLDTKVEGRKSDGQTKSEIIESAASGGFASQGYKDVFVEYEDVAEEVLESEQVPPGYRYYVRRYFDLIRPREAAAP